MSDISKITLPDNTSYNIKDGSAIANITRDGTTFTATKRDGTTFTFTQQDNNITHTALSLGFGYGTCSTAAGTKAKVGTLSSGVLGSNGSIVAIKFTKSCTVANPTLNINSKGAKNIYWHGAALTDTALIKAGDIVTFMYDGTQYHIISISPIKYSTTNITPVTSKTVVTSTTATSITYNHGTLNIPASIITSTATGASVTSGTTVAAITTIKS